MFLVIQVILMQTLDGVIDSKPSLLSSSREERSVFLMVTDLENM